MNIELVPQKIEQYKIPHQSDLFYLTFLHLFVGGYYMYHPVKSTQDTTGADTFVAGSEEGSATVCGFSHPKLGTRKK